MDLAGHRPVQPGRWPPLCPVQGDGGPLQTHNTSPRVPTVERVLAATHSVDRQRLNPYLMERQFSSLPRL